MPIPNISPDNTAEQTSKKGRPDGLPFLLSRCGIDGAVVILGLVRSGDSVAALIR
jgi:hypothetical protein